MKIKIFQEINFRSIDRLEEAINSWLKTGVDIKQFSQSINSNGRLLHTFLYYDKKELRKEKLDKINKT